MERNGMEHLYITIHHFVLLIPHKYMLRHIKATIPCSLTTPVCTITISNKNSEGKADTRGYSDTYISTFNTLRYNWSPQMRVSKKHISTHNNVVKESQINDLNRTLIEKLGIAVWDKYNYLVYKEDYEDTNDSVTAHRVAVGYRGSTLSYDTTFVLIDTTECYVETIYHSYKGIRNQLFTIRIDNKNQTGYEQGVKWTNFNSSAGHEFYNTPTLKVAIKDLGNHYFVATDKQINNLNHQLQGNIGVVHWDKYNYLIFKDDFESASDSVVAYRVSIFYATVE